MSQTQEQRLIGHLVLALEEVANDLEVVRRRPPRIEAIAARLLPKAFEPSTRHRLSLAGKALSRRNPLADRGGSGALVSDRSHDA